MNQALLLLSVIIRSPAIQGCFIDSTASYCYNLNNRRIFFPQCFSEGVITMIRNRSRAIFPVICAAVLFAFTASSTEIVFAASDTLIVPGERINGFILGKTNYNQIRSILGEPDSDGCIRQSTPHGMAYNTATHKVYNSSRLVFSFDEKTGCLRQVEIWSASYATAKGVKVGSSEKNIVAEFGKPDNSDAQLGELTLTYFRRGIRFFLAKGRVYLIELFMKNK